ncbi:DEAD/DEAH box helicase [Candidatus Woesearchaeota archaeon]|nr:DEAD/DEAH box helicase [Candidatus Woesearchaeota archaeon]
MTDFKDLNLKPELQKALAKLHYITPTPIQIQAIPGLMKGSDLIGIAQTGTGKTAAFTLPILHRMKEGYPRTIKTLVLAPTRELAAQIGESFAKYGEFLKFKHTVIFGGVSQGRQVDALKKGVDILVATPGRLMDLLNQGLLTLRDVEFFVLDEADRMLDMGFIHDIKKVIAKLPQRRQSLFFSATMSSQVNMLARSLLRDPIHVEVTPQATTVERITQEVYFVDQKSKDKLLLDLLQQEHLTSILVFTRTKHKANKVAVFLNQNKISAEAIHGNKSQNARTKAIENFKSGKVKVLVATDIAARGIDIDNISHVINYELPNEPESYVHRIGRTARAGADGTAFSFCDAEERNYLRDIIKLIKQELEVIKHKYHSEKAEYAVGDEAKPAKKQGRGQRHRGSKPQGNNSGNSDGSKRSFTKTYKGKSQSRGGKQRRQSTRK